MPDGPATDPNYADLSRKGRWAVAYGAYDWPVIPLWPPNGPDCTCPKNGTCGSPGKHPLGHPWAVPKGLHSASTNTQIIAGWWRRAQTLGIDPNIGLVPPHGRVVIDIDNVEQAKKTLGDAFPLLHGAPTVVTGREGKGYHAYFTVDEGSTIKFNAGFGGGETKGDGEGYVVAPPSLHSSGTEYRWAQHGLVPRLPSPLVDALTPHESPVRRTSGSIPGTVTPTDSAETADEGFTLTVTPGSQIPDAIETGSRYGWIRDRIASARGAGYFERKVVWDIVRDELLDKFQPPLTETEFRDRFDRVWEYDEKHPDRIESRRVARPKVSQRERSDDEILSEILMARTVVSASAPSPVAGDWLVHDLIKPGTLCVLASREGLGKSWLRTELGLMLAIGVGNFMEWDAYGVTKPRRVVLLDAENGHDLEHEREELVLDSLGHDRSELADRYVRYSFLPTSLVDADGQKFIEAIVDQDRPDLLILDTATAMIGDEWGKEFKAGIAFIRALIARYGIAVLLVVHRVKPPRERGPAAEVRITDVMGHWTRSADTVMAMDDDAEDEMRAKLRIWKKVPNAHLVLAREDNRWIVKDTVGKATAVTLKVAGQKLGITHAKGPTSKVKDQILGALGRGISTWEVFSATVAEPGGKSNFYKVLGEYRAQDVLDAHNALTSKGRMTYHMVFPGGAVLTPEKAYVGQSEVETDTLDLDESTEAETTVDSGQ